jgi:integrase
VGRPVWWGFLRISDGGWSSECASVDLILRHLARKSRSVASRDMYCYTLWRVCSSKEVREKIGNGIGPDELISMARQNLEVVTRAIQDFADKYNDAGSVRYANSIIHLIKSFFKVNKVDLDLHGYFQPTRSRRRPEYVPSLLEALKMADAAGSLRNRLIILSLIYTGLRNATLRALVYDESYSDPLLQEHTIKKELEREEQCLMIIVHEAMKRCVPNACKNRVFYYTFIPPKVTEHLRLYLQERKEKYGGIFDYEPIFITENRRISLSERRKTPISSRELEEIVKKAAKRAGIRNWKNVYPHCLRKTYESFLRNQPDDVRLDVKEREFLFGHTLPGSQDAYFDKTKIEEMRAKYAKMNFEPAIVETEERVVSTDELQSFLEHGWRFVATLPDGKVVVSRKVKRTLEAQSITKKLEQNQTQTIHPATIHDQRIQENASENARPLEDSASKVNILQKEGKHSHITSLSSLLPFLYPSLQSKIATNNNNDAKPMKNDMAGAIEAPIKQKSKQACILSYIN